MLAEPCRFRRRAHLAHAHCPANLMNMSCPQEGPKPRHRRPCSSISFRLSSKVSSSGAVVGIRRVSTQWPLCGPPAATDHQLHATWSLNNQSACSLSLIDDIPWLTDAGSCHARHRQRLMKPLAARLWGPRAIFRRQHCSTTAQSTANYRPNHHRDSRRSGLLCPQLQTVLVSDTIASQTGRQRCKSRALQRFARPQ